eukprot:6178951-Pleurochrysis_carterae.AAC.1
MTVGSCDPRLVSAFHVGRATVVVAVCAHTKRKISFTRTRMRARARPQISTGLLTKNCMRRHARAH